MQNYPACNGLILMFNIQLQLVVSDSGDPVLSSDPYVFSYEILDVNDHPPLFEKSSYTMTVQENHANTTVGIVTAVDADRNSVSCYSIGIYLFIYLGNEHLAFICFFEKMISYRTCLQDKISYF